MPSTSPLVSIVIASRNRNALLQRAIASINSQSYSNIEIILIDNCSDQPIICEDLPQGRPITIYRNTEPKGLYVNRNLGSERATGDIVCYLDDDDTYFPHKVQECVEAFDADRALDFVWANTEQVGPNGQTLCLSRGPIELTQFLRYRYVHLNTLAIRRNVLTTLRFNDDMTKFGDIQFVGQLIKDYRGKHIDSTHAYWYRDERNDQITRRDWRGTFKNWRKLCDVFEDEIDASALTRRFYHRKMLLLALMYGDARQAIKSASRIF